MCVILSYTISLIQNNDFSSLERNTKLLFHHKELVKINSSQNQFLVIIYIKPLISTSVSHLTLHIAVFGFV